MAALAAAVVWAAAGDAAITEKPMSRAAVTADIAAVELESDAAPETSTVSDTATVKPASGAVPEPYTVTGVTIVAADKYGRPPREECLVTKDFHPVAARGTASRITASLRRHGWRPLDPAPRQSPDSVRYARRGWTLSVSHFTVWNFSNFEPGEDWNFLALMDTC
ncbi:hypothetical protein ACFYXS_11685 [Streptomyces sp. NPDC002574]|uniref:hypothetical protein n=1 Tax=Streptomyces sp. NPDC002574 TaxID=3364652 RepID=UPI0036A435B6